MTNARPNKARRPRADAAMKEASARIGGRIAHARAMAGVSRLQLARMVGVSQQQLQKYETGANRVCVPRLLAIAEALNVPFRRLVDFPQEEGGSNPFATASGRLCLQAMRNLMRVANPARQQAVASLVRALADAEGEETESPQP
ncbi:MAG: helix-turn-helix domain-containing protein [Rickettsiales bacterium]